MRKGVKKLVALMLAAMMMFSLVACGSDASTASSSDTKTETKETTEVKEEETKEEEPEVTEAAEEEAEPEVTEEPEATEAPEVTEEPEATEAPEVTEAAEEETEEAADETVAEDTDETAEAETASLEAEEEDTAAVAETEEETTEDAAEEDAEVVETEEETEDAAEENAEVVETEEETEDAAEEDAEVVETEEETEDAAEENAEVVETEEETEEADVEETPAVEEEETTEIAEADAEETPAAEEETAEPIEVDPDFKMGVILIGDETEGYSKAHMDGIKEAAEEIGMDASQIVWKYKVPEDSTCYDSAVDLIGQGCSLVISNSYGHQTYMVQAAQEYPDTTFVSMTGDFAGISGCDNFKNAFTNIYEARYVSGVVAGLKLKEILEDGTLTEETQPDSFDADGNVKIGYVGAFSYAEVVSGYTAFYLGVKSVVPNVVMEVKYTNSWFDIDKEGAAAEALIANGAVIIGQHADSTGAPAATQKLQDSGKICYSIGYNIDMLETAPTAALTSATNDWNVYYKYAIETAMTGGEIETDWSNGYNEGAVSITAFGESCAEGTAEYIADVEAQLRDGSLKVFDTATFTVGGEEVTTAECDLSFLDFTTNPPTVVYEGETVEAIEDGCFAESTFRSAPYFTLRIDGITEDTEE